MSPLQVFHSASFLNTEKKTELPYKGKVKNKIVLVQTVGCLLEPCSPGPSPRYKSHEKLCWKEASRTAAAPDRCANTATRESVSIVIANFAHVLLSSLPISRHWLAPYQCYMYLSLSQAAVYGYKHRSWTDTCGTPHLCLVSSGKKKKLFCLISFSIYCYFKNHTITGFFIISDF